MSKFGKITETELFFYNKDNLIHNHYLLTSSLLSSKDDVITYNKKNILTIKDDLTPNIENFTNIKECRVTYTNLIDANKAYDSFEGIDEAKVCKYFDIGDFWGDTYELRYQRYIRSS